MEILQVYAHLYVEKVSRIDTTMEKLTRTSIWQDSEFRINLIVQLEQLCEMCITGELPVTKIRLDRVIHCLKSPERDTPADSALMIQTMSDHLLAHYLMDARQRLIDELSTKLFFQLPHERKEKFENPLKGWEVIIKRFEDVARDVEEMNKCFSLSRYTAAMFHAMQIAELGAIALGNCIGVTDPKKGWGPTQRRLEQLIKAGRNALPANLGTSFDFLEQMNREIDSMTLSWRHKIDHAANRLAILPNTDFTPDIAEHITSAVRVFMLRLGEGMPI
jgi:hypothetical protein